MNFDAVLFDCDGVLVDSETLSNRVLRDMLEERGWVMSLQQCMDIFVGNTVADFHERIARETGQPFTLDWLEQYRIQRDRILLRDVEAVAQIHAAVDALYQCTRGRIACASGADRPKIEMMLRKVGLAGYFEGRIFSGQELARSKPHPDVYLAAAAHLGVAPQRCAVVEDTLTGLVAGVAAGATVFAYAPHGKGQALLQAGAAQVFSDMAELPALLGAVPPLP